MKRKLAVVMIGIVSVLIGSLFAVPVQSPPSEPSIPPSYLTLTKRVDEIEAQIEILDETFTQQINNLRQDYIDLAIYVNGTLTPRIDNLQEDHDALSNQVNALQEEHDALSSFVNTWVYSQIVSNLLDIRANSRQIDDNLGQIEGLTTQLTELESTVETIIDDKQDEIQIYSAWGWSTIETTSPWGVDMEDMSITLNLEKDSYLIIAFSCYTWNSLDAVNVFRCKHGNTLIGEARDLGFWTFLPEMSFPHTFSHHFFEEAAPGIHTIKIQWCTNGGRAEELGNRELHIIVVPFDIE